MKTIYFMFVFFVNISCTATFKTRNFSMQPDGIIPAAERLGEYLPLLNGKKVALLVNQTSRVGGAHLVDVLRAHQVSIKKIFAPEHGFRGDADAGTHLSDFIDKTTGIPVVSLFGEKLKPSQNDLADVDIVVYDIQDVGVRFYTYISTLHHLMQACAENNKRLIILDRPNPNGWYVGGPVLRKEFRSFLGVDKIPVVHGLTLGEYAQMVNGEKWLTDEMQCDLKVITCLNYDHSSRYDLPVHPSPNLRSPLAVALYPSLGLFEGTSISVGRGTDSPFEIIGSPNTKIANGFEFVPRSSKGAKSPKYMDQKCFGIDLRKKANAEQKGFTLAYLLDMYKLDTDKSTFFSKNNFFDLLAGTDEIRKMIVAGKSEAEICSSFASELKEYMKTRKKYLLYEDFEK